MACNVIMILTLSLCTACAQKVQLSNSDLQEVVEDTDSASIDETARLMVADLNNLLRTDDIQSVGALCQEACDYMDSFTAENDNRALAIYTTRMRIFINDNQKQLGIMASQSYLIRDFIKKVMSLPYNEKMMQKRSNKPQPIPNNDIEMAKEPES